MGASSISEEEAAERGFHQAPQSSAEAKARTELYFYFISGPTWLFVGRKVYSA